MLSSRVFIGIAILAVAACVTVTEIGFAHSGAKRNGSSSDGTGASASPAAVKDKEASPRKPGIPACSVRQLVLAGRAEAGSSTSGPGELTVPIDQPIKNVGPTCRMKAPGVFGTWPIQVENAKGVRRTVTAQPFNFDDPSDVETLGVFPRHERRLISLAATWPLDKRVGHCKDEIKDVTKAAISLRGGYLQINGFGGYAWDSVCVSSPEVSITLRD